MTTPSTTYGALSEVERGGKLKGSSQKKRKHASGKPGNNPQGVGVGNCTSPSLTTHQKEPSLATKKKEVSRFSPPELKESLFSAMKRCVTGRKILLGTNVIDFWFPGIGKWSEMNARERKHVETCLFCED